MQCPFDIDADALHHAFDMRHETGEKCSALGIAILNDMYPVAERLIELGADVNEYDNYLGKHN